MEGEAEGVVEETGLVTTDPSTGEWTTTHYTPHHQEMGSVVHIIVPDLSCMSHGKYTVLFLFFNYYYLLLIIVLFQLILKKVYILS